MIRSRGLGKSGWQAALTGVIIGGVLLPAHSALALPDLVPTALTPPASAVAGGSAISVSYTVTNQGDGTASPSWRERVYLSTDNVFDNGDLLVPGGQFDTTSGLAPSTSYSNMLTLSIPGTTAPGSYFLIIYTDVNNSVAESDDSTASNTLATAITITKPNLVPTALTPPASAVAGGSAISVSYTVTNQGDGTASPSWRERVYLSTDNVFDNGDLLVPRAHLHDALPISPSTSYSNMLTLSIPGTTAPGSYFLIIYTD